MNLTQQVISLDLAKRLKGLKVKQESLFYWHNGKLACPTYQEYNIVENNWISAFTVGELGEMLGYWVTTRKKIDHWIATHHYMEAEKDINDTTEANARAKMLIWLIEQGHVKNE